MNIDKVVTENKLILIRKYPWEILIVMLIAWNIMLTAEVRRLNKEKEDYFRADRDKLMELIKENNRVIEKNNILFESNLKK